jgi:hypothetical protein
MSSEYVPKSSRNNVYQLAFIKRCHRLLELGYCRLDRKALICADEPSITGELVRAMKEAQEIEDAPAFTRFLFVADDPPQNSFGKLGKRRRRVDIEFEFAPRKGKRPRFHFEAKRLYKSASISDYLGPEGLGCFLAGHYAKDQDAGGMLGYVQTESINIWSKKLETAIIIGRNELGVLEPSDSWGIIELAPMLHSRRSRHRRSTVGTNIVIYHSLLEFA